MRFEVLGPLRVRRDDLGAVEVRGRTRRLMLAMLVAAWPEPVSRSAFVEALWPEVASEAAEANLRSYLSRLRSELGERDRIERLESTYRIVLEAGELDAAEFGGLVGEGRRAIAVGDLEHAATLLDRALGLWRGDPYAAQGDSAFLQPEIHRLEDLRRQTRELYTAVRVDLGLHDGLIPDLTVMRTNDPYNDELVRLLMLAHYKMGQQIEALDIYRAYRAELDAEFGVEPGSELHDLQRAVLNGQLEVLAVRRPSAAPRTRPGPAVPALLPMDLAGFTGRTAELDRLDSLLPTAEDGRSAAVAISAVSGTAGVGKTALAVHWAHRVADQFPDGQLYVNLRGFDPSGNPMTAGQAVRRFLDAFGVPPQRIPADPEAHVDLYRSLLSGKKVLVVLDNAHDSYQVRSLLPGTPGCVVVVTSRDALSDLLAYQHAVHVNLDTFTDTDAHAFLEKRLGPERITAEPGAARDIIVSCARLPLALGLAAAHSVVRRDLALTDLAAELHRTRLDTLQGETPDSGVRAVFSWSYAQLEPEAQRLFRLLGLHPGPDTTVAATASLAAVPLEDCATVFRTLTEAHLLTEHVPGRYTFHDLLRTYARERTESVDSEEERQAAAHRLLDHYLHTAHAADGRIAPARDPITITLHTPRAGVVPERIDDEKHAMAWFAAELSVLLATFHQATAADLGSHVWPLAWTLDSFLIRLGLRNEHDTVWRAALNASERQGDPSAQAYAHRALAHTHLRPDCPADNQRHALQALDRYVRLADRIGQAWTHEVISGGHARQTRWTDALHHAQQALQLAREAGHQRFEARFLNAVGWYAAHLGQLNQALDDCRQALTQARSIDDQVAEVAALDSLGYIHRQLGQHHKAVQYYRRAVTGYQELGGRFRQADTLDHLGDAHQAAGDTAAARDAWRQAIDILDDLDHHPDTDTIRAKLLVLESNRHP